MSTTVKSLKVTHNLVNDSDTFTSGDEVTGQVTLEVVKECHIDSLSIKFKGKSEVLWTERYGQTTVIYHSKDKYFSNKCYFVSKVVTKIEIYSIMNPRGNREYVPFTVLKDQSGEKYNSVVAPGCHVYPFTFKIRKEDFPSSFTGSAGKITYSLEARLSRSMRVPKKDTEKLNFVGRGDLTGELLEPQHDCKDKKLKIFSSGTVSMDVRLDKTGYFQGEGIEVKAHIQNNSSRPIRPKYRLYRKHSFFAGGKRRVDTVKLLKEVGEPIPPSTEEDVTRIITIPLDMEPSIHNCVNIKVEHRLKVYLDVKYATDPEIKFPIVILPISAESSALPSPAAESDFEAGFSKQTLCDAEPPAGGVAPSGPPALDLAPSGPPAGDAAPPGEAGWGVAPSGEATDTQAVDPPPPYGAHAMYPPPSQ